MNKKFYVLVKEIDDCCDTITKNEHGVIAEKGITFNDDYFITYGLDDGLIHLYAKDKEILSFGENSPLLDIFDEIIDLIHRIEKEVAHEGQAQKQPRRQFVPEDSNGPCKSSISCTCPKQK